MKYNYQAEKFAQARSCLMLPHPKGEAQSVALAFHKCLLGLEDLDEQSIENKTVSEFLRKLKKYMDTTGIEATEEGTFSVKAERFNDNEKLDISILVDELAHWFTSQSYQK